MTIEIANRLCAYRKKNGFSQEELAEKIGVSRQAVSKWERAEASPDTDNLILLSQVYHVTLDDLLNKDPDAQEEKTSSTDSVSFKNGIHINSANGDDVHVDWSGVHVDSANGDHVCISLHGIMVDENTTTDTCDEEPLSTKRKHPFISDGLWALLCCFAYLLFGCLNICGGWGLGWLVFLTIPLYSSVWEAIEKKDVSEFCYPVFVTFLYLVLGFFLGWWHPAWILFVTIPIFYSACKAFKKA